MWYAIYLTGFLASIVMAVYYSIIARSRNMHPLLSRMTLGKMNMAIGVLFLMLGSNQFTFEDLTGIRIGVAIVLLFMGVINLFLGTRNYLRYRRSWQQEVKKNG